MCATLWSDMTRTPHTRTLRKKVQSTFRGSLRRVWVTICTWAHDLYNARVKTHNVRKDKEISMKTFKWRLTGVLATFVVAATLAACGGGGGTSVGDKPFTDPVEVKGTLNSTSPAPVSAGASTSMITLTWATTQGTPTLPTVVSTMSTTAIGTSANGNASVQVPLGTSTFSFLNSGTTLATVSVTASCATGTTQVGTVCTAPAPVVFWPPAAITAVGTKVFTANQLPNGCNAAAEQCWKDAVKNGTVKFVASGATQNGRAIVFAYFRNTSTAFGVTGLWNVLPIYADDGSLAASDISGGISTEIDYVQGSTVGAIVHEKVNGMCFEFFLSGNWISRAVACPA